MKIVILNTQAKTDKELKDLLLNDLKAFKKGRGRFLGNNKNRLGNAFQFA